MKKTLSLLMMVVAALSLSANNFLPVDMSQEKKPQPSSKPSSSISQSASSKPIPSL